MKKSSVKESKKRKIFQQKPRPKNILHSKKINRKSNLATRLEHRRVEGKRK